MLARHPEIEKARLVVDRDGDSDVMTLHCETEGGADESAVAESLREACKLKGGVKLVGVGELPNDGKVIEDARSYD